MRWKRRNPREAHGEFESEFPGYCGAQDTFYVGNMKGVARIDQQTFIDTYSKVAFARLYDRKTPITVAELLNDRVVPFFDARCIPLNRIMTDRGTEYCGIRSITNTSSTSRQRYCRALPPHRDRGVAFRKKIYPSIAALQSDLDEWIAAYNEVRPHQGRWCYGKTPMQTLLDASALSREKLLPTA